MRALKVPFEIDPSGRISTVEGEYPVLAAYIHALLMTRRGERVMRPGFGSSLPEAVFEPLGTVFEAELEGDIRDAIRLWEPDVEIHEVNFSTWEETQITVEVIFSVRSNLAGAASTVSVVIDVGGTVEEGT